MRAQGHFGIPDVLLNVCRNRFCEDQKGRMLGIWIHEELEQHCGQKFYYILHSINSIFCFSNFICLPEKFSKIILHLEMLNMQSHVLILTFM